MCHVSLICYYLVVGGSINRRCHFTEEEIQTERVKGTAQIRIPARPARALLTTLPSSAPLQAAAKDQVVLETLLLELGFRPFLSCWRSLVRPGLLASEKMLGNFCLADY